MNYNFYTIESFDKNSSDDFRNQTILSNVILKRCNTREIQIHKSSVILFDNSDYPLDKYNCSCIFVNKINDNFHRYVLSNIKPNGYQNIEKHIESAIAEFYCNISNYLNYNLKKKYNGVYVFCSLFYYDFCIVIDLCNSNNSLIEDIYKEIDEHLDMLCSDSLYSTSKQDKEYILDKFKNIYEKQISVKSLKYNKHYIDYCNYIKRLENLCNRSIDKQTECLLIASLILKLESYETYTRWIHNSGDIRYENANITSLYDNNYNYLAKCLDLFIEQTNLKNIKSDLIWSILFITQGLIANILGLPDKTKNDICDNIFGLYPIFSNDNEVRSNLIMHYSPVFSFGFFMIPERFSNSIWEYFPAYIHELFHYIPPENRNERNETITKLIFHSVFNKLKNNIFEVLPYILQNSTDKFSKEDVIELCKNVFDAFLDNFFKLFRKNIFFDNYEVCYIDSMNYIESVREVINVFDFKYSYKLSVKNTKDNLFEILDKYSNLTDDHILYKIIAIIENSENTSYDVWGKYVKDYLNTFTILIREIRSDMLMCSILDIDMEKYIELMANEQDFARLDKDNCADSIILRFGIITRYLYYKKSEVIFSDIDNNKYYSKCIEIINNLYHSENKKIYTNLNHLKDYIQEYIDISIESMHDHYTENGHSTIENQIIPLLEVWESEIDKYKNKKFIKILIKLYHKYKFCDSDYSEKCIFDFGTRIIFRDLFEYIPYFEEIID